MQLIHFFPIVQTALYFMDYSIQRVLHTELCHKFYDAEVIEKLLGPVVLFEAL